MSNHTVFNLRICLFVYMMFIHYQHGSIVCIVLYCGLSSSTTTLITMVFPPTSTHFPQTIRFMVLMMVNHCYEVFQILSTTHSLPLLHLIIFKLKPSPRAHKPRLFLLRSYFERHHKLSFTAPNNSTFKPSFDAPCQNGRI